MSKISIEAVDAASAVQTLTGLTMGGAPYSARFHGGPTPGAEALGAALFAAVDAVDGQMSNWIPGSDINRLNEAPVDAWVSLPAELIAVLDCALGIGRASGGAFDIAVNDLVTAWGFGPPARRPDPVRMKALAGQKRVSAREALELDLAGGRARRTAPVTFDLSGIAKGFGVDQMGRCLAAHGILNYLVSIDGEVLAAGRKPDGGKWTVAVQRPDSAEAAPYGVVELVDEALATSGDYRNWIKVGERRLSHTMNPRAGVPIHNGVASVSVLHDSCMQADAWATALMVLGPEAGLALSGTLELSALLLVRKGDGFEALTAGAFAAAAGRDTGAAGTPPARFTTRNR